MATKIQVLNEGVCLSPSANTFAKVTNPTILPLAMDE